MWGYRTAVKTTGVPHAGHFVREVPGSHKVRSWEIRGDVIGGGPGYVAYIPPSDLGSVDVSFPLQHRTLRFRGLDRPSEMRLVIPSSVAWMGGAGRQWYLDPAMQVVLVGTGRKMQEIEISR